MTKLPDSQALSVFFRSLAVMVGAGVGLDRSLDHLGKQSDDPRMAALASDISRRVGAGTTISSAFAAHKEVFSELQIRTMAVGERTGNLHLVLSRLADYEEKRRATAMKVKAALVYPMFLVGLATFMLIVLPPYMFGGLFQMIDSMSIEPPLLTRLVMGISDFIRTPLFWALTLLAAGLAWKGLPLLWAKPGVQTETARAALQLPVVGPFFRTLATARFARALELQLGVGESPLHGLALAFGVSGNPVLTEQARAVVESLKGGNNLVGSLKAADFFPRTFLDLAAAGEESAHLPEMMGRAAQMYETDLDHAIDRFTALLEPLIMLVMGIIVGIVVVATMLPMMTLIQTL